MNLCFDERRTYYFGKENNKIISSPQYTNKSEDNRIMWVKENRTCGDVAHIGLIPETNM